MKGPTVAGAVLSKHLEAYREMCHTSVQSRLEARRVKHQLQVLSQAEALATTIHETPVQVRK